MTEKTTKRSLKEYVLDKKRQDCAVCRLPSELLQQVREASKRKISRADVVEWLMTEHKIAITSAQFDAHNSGRHQP